MKSQNSHDIVNVCPPPLPAKLGHRNTFLDSILVAQEKLEKPILVSEFLKYMLTWAGRTPEKSRRYLQNVLNAYYIIGLTPRIYWPSGARDEIQSEIPISIRDDLPAIRRYCLQMMTVRLARMETFWGAIAHHEPFTTTELASLLQPNGFSLDDIKRRLRLMLNLGACTKTGHSYRLTQLGVSFAEQAKGHSYEINTNIRQVADSKPSWLDDLDDFQLISILDG